MPATNGVQISFGGGQFGQTSVEETREWLVVLEESKIDRIDTAQLYGESEKTMGEAGAASKFVIDTKVVSGWGEVPATEEEVIRSGKQSLELLKTDSVDVYFMHAPDRRVPIKESLSGLNELYKQGAIKRVGLSNFSASEIDEAIRVAKENGFVVPSVYQGNYNAISRHTETELFPVIRKHGLSFQAYSPIGGGFLSKTKESLTNPEGRFGQTNPIAQMYQGMYNKPSFLAALDDWQKAADAEKTSRSELAYRWVFYHSKLSGTHGDAVIVGARTPDQFRETVQAIKAGPLGDAAVESIEAIWQNVKADSILDNYTFVSAASASK